VELTANTFRRHGGLVDASTPRRLGSQSERGRFTLRRRCEGQGRQKVGRGKRRAGPWLMATVGRSLDAKEAAFIRKVPAAFFPGYANNGTSRAGTRRGRNGLRLGGYGWEALTIWPALTAKRARDGLRRKCAQGKPSPDPGIMLHITDASAIQERMAAGSARREIESGTKPWAIFPFHGPTRPSPAAARRICAW